MSENNDSKPGKGLLQGVFDKFKKVTEDVSEKVGDTIENVKNSEKGGQIVDAAKNLGNKAQEIVHDIKDSNVAEKAKNLGGDISNFCSSKVKGAIGKINFDDTINTLKEKQASSGKDMSKLINFVEKLQNIK